MATFVLVHGSWHGGWCWKRLTPLLRADGHRVFTPTLTGLGDRSHLATRDVGLDTHIEDVRATLYYEDLRDVVLVGHSYACMVVTGVADVAADRLRQVVLFDGSFPVNGQALLDLIPPDRKAALIQKTNALGEGWRMPPPGPAEWGVTDPADIAWMEPRLVPHPIKCVLTPLNLSGAGNAVPRTYISCTDRTRNQELLDGIAQAKADGWGYEEVASGHDAMVTHPRELADVLERIAAR